MLYAAVLLCYFNPGGEAGEGAIEGILGVGVPPRPSNPTLFKTKITYFATMFKTRDTTF